MLFMFDKLKYWFAHWRAKREQKKRLPAVSHKASWKYQRWKGLHEAKKEEKLDLPTISHVEKEHKQFAKEGYTMKPMIMRKRGIDIEKFMYKPKKRKKKVVKKKVVKKKAVKKRVVKKKVVKRKIAKRKVAKKRSKSRKKR